MNSLTIVYVIGLNTIAVNNGIKRQAEIWGDGLKKKGHTVILYSPWDIPDWSKVDLIHVFGNGLWLIETITNMSLLNIPIIVSPIIDSYKPIWLYKLVSYLGISKLRLFSTNFALRYLKPKIALILVRSYHEFKYVNIGYGYDNRKISILRLPSRLSMDEGKFKLIQKDDFCLHVSMFTQPRKNVYRLMEAAAKYKFKLKIAGMPGSEIENAPFYNFAKKYSNIEILGTISDEKLIELYKRAKVFALPSIEEGVGFVALEAASFGCNIVITNIGGPKEYYDGKAIEVDPFNIDEIGQAVNKALSSPTNDVLANYIKLNYSIEKNIVDLVELYYSIIK